MGERLKRMRELFGVEQRKKEIIERWKEKNSNISGEIMEKGKIEKGGKIKVTKQKNSYDCGIYVMGNIQRILQ
jgi:Ulp1 family protease